MFTVQIEYGTDKYAHFESCEGFETMDEAYEFATECLNEAAALIRDGEIADNAIIRIWREDKTGKLINSCERGC